MYDFIKIAVTDQKFAEGLIVNPLLDFNTLVNERTGVMKDGVQCARHKNLDFTTYPSGRVEIQGSLHKYWNDGLHNWNDFNLNDVKSCISDLQATFSIDPDKATVHNLEFGLNVSTAYNPDAFLTSLVTHKKEPFNKMKTRGQGNGKEVYYGQYGIKVYNKGLQYNRPDNILRFEKKVFKMECLGWGEIKLKDLLSPAFFNHCLTELLSSYDELLITDKVNESALSKAKLKLFHNCKNPLNWGEMTPEQRYKKKAKFCQLVREHGKFKYMDNTRDLLEKKGHVLTGVLKVKRSVFDSSISRSISDYLLSEKFAESGTLEINYKGAFSIGVTAQQSAALQAFLAN